MDGQSTKILGGQKEKYASFWLASQELMANGFQKEIDTLKKEVISLKIENHTLKTKLGAMQEEICSRSLTMEDCNLFRDSMISWGDIASFLSSKQMGFYQELLLVSTQKWMQPNTSGTQTLISPIKAFRERLLELLKCSQSQEMQESAINSLADFVVSVICFREYDISHDDVKTIEEVFEAILQQVAKKERSNDHPWALPLLKEFMNRDASRCIITRTICKMCSDISSSLCEEVIGFEETSLQRESNHLANLDFVELCSFCQICVSKLSPWPQSNCSQGRILEDIAEYIWKISKQCDILGALSPAIAFEGKRLYCRLIASLQAMGA